MGREYHLTLKERIIIQSLIENDNTAKEIAEYLKRDVTTIRRDVKQNRYMYKNETNKFIYSNPVKCHKLDRFPYTCIFCQKFKSGGCLSAEKSKYIAEKAHEYYRIKK